MNSRRLAVLGFAAVLAVTAGCPTKKEETSGFNITTPVTPVLSANPTAITADGIESTVITVSTGTAPVTLTTTRGTFANGTTSISVAVVPGTATLTPCNAQVTASCAGVAVVSATTADSATNTLSVVFSGFEVCGNGVDDNGNGDVDCADAQCTLDMPCSATGLVCSSTQLCNKCTVPAPGVVEASLERTCTDNLDNDCDGLTDCADPDCEGETCNITSTSTGSCVAGGGCACDQTEVREATCGDGKDNDCDGLLDCVDSDCLGVVCDSITGMQCAGVAPITCRHCPSGQTAESATQCADGKDNDCDGKVDCYDTDCQPVGLAAGKTCNPNGGVCMLTNGVPSCGCSTGATIEATCSDGVDDDCDGSIDCADDDCQPAGSGLVGQSCGQFGRACGSSGTCNCPTGDVELCSNYDGAGQPVDDDCDGLANCIDRSCRPTTPGGTGEDCSQSNQVGMACDAGGVCACTGNGGVAEVPSEITCDDGFDNNCDYLVDCQDPSCSTRACNAFGSTCVGGVCTCASATETSCTNGLDENCNGKIDCEEPSCAAQACSGTFTAYLCLSGVCADPSTEYAVKVTPARGRIPAQLGASTVLAVEVTFKGAAKSGASVSLALSDPALGTLTPATPVTTDSQGRASVTFTSSGSVGVETVTATYTIAVGSTASGTTTVTMPAIGEIRLAENGILFPVMGVKTSGFQEQNQLAVEVVDPAGQLYPDGLDVTFEHRTLGGSTLNDPFTSGTCVAPSCVRSLARTDTNGVGRVRLYSGTIAGVVRVSATATAGGVARLFELPSIAIVGAKPNASHFSVVCGTANVPALYDSTCYVSRIEASFTCSAFLKDRYNNLLGRATTVSFMSEAGAVGPPALTPEYDPGQPPSSQGDLGTAIEVINTLGAKLPKDVVPNLGEASVSTAADGCGITQRNPRDGVVTVVAWTSGEEEYFDSNGNGLYDAGEPFVDLPEPFVDYDDDDVRDADEPFIDTNTDGVWNAPNGSWDSNTNIWTKTIVLYTGYPAWLQIAGDEYKSRWMELADAATYPASTPAAAFDIHPDLPADPFNDCNGDQIRNFALESYEETADPASPDYGTYTPGADTLNDCDGDGQLDAAPVQEPFSDTNGNPGFDPVLIPADSETLVVTASDQNLNRLSATATYAVKLPDGVGFDFTYSGQDALPDRYGLDFGYQPCNSALPASCALDCADIAPPGGHCVMRSRVSNYSYGYTAGVTFRGGSVGTADGATEAYWDISLFEQTLRVVVPGTHQ